MRLMNAQWIAGLLAVFVAWQGDEIHLGAASAAKLPVQQVELWFHEQKLDHFDLTSTARNWAQRYFEIDAFISGPDAPVLLYLCGEYTCNGIMETRQFPLLLAERYGALIVSLEHRFFGASQPFDDLAVENLKYLNVRQAMADTAVFVNFIQSELNLRFNKSSNNKFFTIGGSYPGAMAAWFRLKYPHLTVGALASSAVVHPMVLYPQFDQQVRISAGEACAVLLADTSMEIERRMPDVKKLFDAEDLSSDDFLYLIADAGAEGVQYSHRIEMCNQLIAAKKSNRSLVAAFSNYTKLLFYNEMGNSPDDYNSDLLRQPNYDPQGAGRQWWWMKCQELGWFQVAPEEGSIRSKRIDLSWHERRCRKLFGETSLFPPNVEATNIEYGGRHIAGSNIMFTNGVEDPWRWASVITTGSPRQFETSVLINCSECAHCQDLHNSSPTDSIELTDARLGVIAMFDELLSGKRALVS